MVTLVFLNNFPMNLGSWNLGRGASNSENKNPNSLKLVPEISGEAWIAFFSNLGDPKFICPATSDQAVSFSASCHRHSPVHDAALTPPRIRLSTYCLRLLQFLLDPRLDTNQTAKATATAHQVSHLNLVVPPMDPKIQSFGGLGLTCELSESVMPPLLMDGRKEKRKMFAAFSKGHLVFEWELWGYFNRDVLEDFGDCVKSISMQVVKPNEQSTFCPDCLHLFGNR
nr:Rho guanine nucleotide exchange factor [Ipomoea batatas]